MLVYYLSHALIAVKLLNENSIRSTSLTAFPFTRSIATYPSGLVTEEIPKLKNALSLYAHVTKIAWKYEQKAKIEGRVNTNSANGEVKVIDKKFPRTEEDRFRLCNSLWDLID